MTQHTSHAACGENDHARPDGGTPATPIADKYVASGGQWNVSASGSFDKVVTYSIMRSGIVDVYNGADPSFIPTTVAMSSFLGFNYTAVLAQAFDIWSAVADVEFIGIKDGGGQIGDETQADIRIGGGNIDGNYGTLAFAFFPGQGAISGDMIFDSAERGFWTPESFLQVAVHEIGHALGLEHETGRIAVMNPTYNPALAGLQSDDISGIRSIYGAQDGGPNVYTMASSMRNLSIFDGAPGLRVNGNEMRNKISGSDSGERIYGFDGNDVLKGNNGNDTLKGQDGDDTLRGGNGNDRLTGGAGDDRLFGQNGRDSLTGSSGEDVLEGGRLRDILRGGADFDTFVFTKARDSGTSGSTRDQIKDFDGSGREDIDLSAIDARSGRGNQSFRFIGDDEFNDRKGELRFEDVGRKKLLVEADIDGDGDADMSILVFGVNSLDRGDFIL